jgi:hypothetical protein
MALVDREQMSIFRLVERQLCTLHVKVALSLQGCCSRGAGCNSDHHSGPALSTYEESTGREADRASILSRRIVCNEDEMRMCELFLSAQPAAALCCGSCGSESSPSRYVRSVILCVRASSCVRGCPSCVKVILSPIPCVFASVASVACAAATPFSLLHFSSESPVMRQHSAAGKAPRFAHSTFTSTSHIPHLNFTIAAVFGPA